ncbi:MAG: glycosyltransferase family 2 protein [bacterium]|nr:glycosyltransferase family 2 protein [bacterium]
MKVIAVIPAFQEASRIEATIRAFFGFVDQIIVVDDGSKDETARVARETGATVLRHKINRGQGAALRTGTAAAVAHGADVIVHVDADGQHDPAGLKALVAPLSTGESDVVFGSRFLGVSSEGMPKMRRWMLKIWRRLVNGYLLGIPLSVTDPQSGMRAMTADAACAIDFKQDRMAHCSEILRLVTRSDLRWKEVPTVIRYTSDSLQKGQKTGDAFDILWQLFIGSFRK